MNFIVFLSPTASVMKHKLHKLKLPKICFVSSGQNQEEPDTLHSGLRPVPKGVSIPGCSPDLPLSPDLTACLESCSLLEHYPDLQVADSGLIPLRATASHCMEPSASDVHHQPECSAGVEPLEEPLLSTSDQGYLVMGASVNVNLDQAGSVLEPLSNSLLNGLLDKQLEEVYLQHLTDNLARCSSHLGNSLLHGLVPPPQPSHQLRGLDSLEVGLGAENDTKISYMSTHNLAHCSSNFSTPVLRISEAENAHQ